MYSFLASYGEKIIHVLDNFGYTGVFLLSLLDRLTVFLIPAEIVLPAFGLLISRGEFSFWPVFMWVTAGNFFGNVALYWVFLKGGRPFLEKYGKYFFVSNHDLRHLDSLFLKYGEKLVFFGYFIPTAVRSLVPIPAGLVGMNLKKFSLYTLVGSIPLNVLYIVVGMKVGNNLDKILAYFAPLNYIVIIAIIILIAWYIYRHKIHRHLTHD